jgi:hypothetical protein
MNFENLVIEKLKLLNAGLIKHSQRRVLKYLRGTYNLLKLWNNPEDVCLAGPYHSEKLKLLNAHLIKHGQRTLFKHLQGTYNLLKLWNNPEDVCLAGLYHSIYSTENFQKSVVTLDKRDEIIAIIGADAEKLVYYFCSQDRQHFFSNLDKAEGFTLFDRFKKIEIPLSKKEFTNLMEIHLANSLEQEPYFYPKYKFKELWVKAKPFVSQRGFQHFLDMYKEVL